jgi:hypothetical protein
MIFGSQVYHRATLVPVLPKVAHFMIKILHNLALFSVKYANFFAEFLAKIFKKS